MVIIEKMVAKLIIFYPRGAKQKRGKTVRRLEDDIKKTIRQSGIQRLEVYVKGKAGKYKHLLFPILELIVSSNKSYLLNYNKRLNIRKAS
jgi:hypothetical protein